MCLCACVTLQWLSQPLSQLALLSFVGKGVPLKAPVRPFLLWCGVPLRWQRRLQARHHEGQTRLETRAQARRPGRCRLALAPVIFVALRPRTEWNSLHPEPMGSQSPCNKPQLPENLFSERAGTLVVQTRSAHVWAEGKMLRARDGKRERERESQIGVP